MDKMFNLFSLYSKEVACGPCLAESSFCQEEGEGIGLARLFIPRTIPHTKTILFTYPIMSPTLMEGIRDIVGIGLEGTVILQNVSLANRLPLRSMLFVAPL